jgi:hypothetical protein
MPSFKLTLVVGFAGLAAAAAAKPMSIAAGATRHFRRRLQPPPPPGGGEMNGDVGGGTSEECVDLPCSSPLLGDVGTTTVDGTDPVTGLLAAGENVYGPFEAGFSSDQDDILLGLGCTEANVEGAYITGGIDTATAVSMVNAACDIHLPYTDSQGTYFDLLDQCGGHTEDYHFHQRLSCLYDAAATGHSTQIAVGNDGQYLYGKYEDTEEYPLLDACGGHFGVTPDSDGEVRGEGDKEREAAEGGKESWREAGHRGRYESTTLACSQGCLFCTESGDGSMVTCARAAGMVGAFAFGCVHVVRVAQEVYHYHVQDSPPFTFGCFGPMLDGECVAQE